MSSIARRGPIVVIVNPRSGRGCAVEAAQAIVLAIRATGQPVHVVHVPATQPLADHLREAQACIVVGGDGTLHHLLADLHASQTPVYHAALGTENLFARQFAMSPNSDRVLDALREPRVASIDLGLCNDTLFAIMVGVGFDGAVVAEVARTRGGSIRKLTYLVPGLRAARAWRAPLVRVEIDALPLHGPFHASLVIANCSRYGGGLNPAPNAQPDDALLDLVLLRCRSASGLVLPALRARLARHRVGTRAELHRAASFRIRADGPGAVLQLDGEAVAPQPSAQAIDADIRVLPGALRVLLPAPLARPSS